MHAAVLELHIEGRERDQIALRRRQDAELAHDIVGPLLPVDLAGEPLVQIAQPLVVADLVAQPPFKAPMGDWVRPNLWYYMTI